MEATAVHRPRGRDAMYLYGCVYQVVPQVPHYLRPVVNIWCEYQPVSEPVCTIVYLKRAHERFGLSIQLSAWRGLSFNVCTRKSEMEIAVAHRHVSCHGQRQHHRDRQHARLLCWLSQVAVSKRGLALTRKVTVLLRYLKRLGEEGIHPKSQVL